MKKLISAFLSLFMVFGLVGCQQDSTNDIKNTVNSYFGYISEANFSKAATLCTEDFEDTLEIDKLVNEMYGQLDTLSLGDEFNKEVQDFVKFVAANIAKVKEHKEVSVKGNEAEAIVLLDVKDYKSFEIGDLTEDQMTEMLETYAKENQQEIEKEAAELSEEELVPWLIGKVASVVFDNFETKIKESPYVEKTAKVQLKKIDKDWKISKITIE